MKVGDIVKVIRKPKGINCDIKIGKIYDITELGIRLISLEGFTFHGELHKSCYHQEKDLRVIPPEKWLAMII